MNRTAKTVGLVLGLLAVPALLFLFGRLLQARGLDEAANWAQLVSIPLAILPLLYPSLRRWWESRRPGPVTSADIEKLRGPLADTVREQWEQESNARGLGDTEPMPIQWRMTDDPQMMDVPGNLTSGVLTSASSADVAGLVADFRALRRRRLVILGGPGAGKTTLAVQVLLELLRGRAADSTDPVPILLSAASWDPERHESLWAWVSERVEKDHPGHATEVVRAFTEQGHVLPVIDGLDEITGKARPALIEAVHAALSADSQLILTSRAGEYREAIEAYGRALPSAVVIEPQPLSVEAAAIYIEQRLPADPGDGWRSILERLRGEDGALAEVVSTPLGLWLLQAAYLTPRADPAPLLDTEHFREAGALRAHLFDRLVEATIKARPPSDRAADHFRPRNQYESADAERWLRFLAVNLDRRTTRDFDWSRDVPALTANPRPERLASAVEQAADLAGGVSELARDLPPRWVKAVAVLAVLLVVSVCVHIGWVFGVIPGVLAGAVAVTVCVALPARLIALADRHEVDGEVDWPVALTRDWQILRGIVMVMIPTVTFGLGYALLVMPAVAVPLALIAPEAGVGRIARAAVVAGSVVGGFALLAFLAGLTTPAGPGDRPPWYGLGPGPGLRNGLFWGILTGVIGGLAAARAYGHNDAILPLIALTTSVACALLVAFRAVLTPILFSLTNLGVAVINRPGPSATDTSPVGLWRSAAAGQQQRYLRIGVLTLLVSATAAVICRLLWASPMWTDPPQPSDFQVAWTGHLRYVAAVFLAWFLTIPGIGRRSWRRWLVWLLIAVLVIRLWPGSLRPDAFRLTLTGEFSGTIADFRLDSSADRVFHPGSGTLRSSLDLADLTGPGDLRRALLIWLGILALGVTLALFWRIDGVQPRVWWTNTITGAPHVLAGRLPPDLVTFLDDAHRLGLLRAVGTTVYQFRHAEFQDHLARSRSDEP